MTFLEVIKLFFVHPILKFLKVDFNQFENIPRDESSGYEAGFEDYYEDDDK